MALLDSWPLRVLIATAMNLHCAFLHTAAACSLTHTEIMEHWYRIENNPMVTLSSFDDEDQVADFVKCKIESLVAHSQPYICGPTEGL